MSPLEDGRYARRRTVHSSRLPRPRMADLRGAAEEERRASAEAEVTLSQAMLSQVIDGTVPSGDVLGAAEMAGVLAAKRAGELLPLAHPAVMSELVVRCVPDRGEGVIRVSADAAAFGRSGVEPQVLAAVSVAAANILDMLRGFDGSVAVRGLRLTGSEADVVERPAHPSPRPHIPAGTRGPKRTGGPAPRRGPF